MAGTGHVGLPVDQQSRAVLLRDLDEFVQTMTDIVRDRQGVDWNPHADNNGEGIALLVRARDDLAPVDGPWMLEGSLHELELLLTRLRSGAVKALQLGAETGAVSWRPEFDLNLQDPEQTDEHLDLMGVCDHLLARLHDRERGI